MKIDRMQASDLPNLVALTAQLGYPTNLEALRERFEIIDRSKTHALLVARGAQGRILGYLQVNAEPQTLLSPRRAEVEALVVQADERGKGIGAALLVEAEAWAKANGFPLVRIRSNVLRTDAHRFYQREGYTLKKSWHCFVKDPST